jgi:hypothetical protein
MDPLDQQCQSDDVKTVHLDCWRTAHISAEAYVASFLQRTLRIQGGEFCERCCGWNEGGMPPSSAAITRLKKEMPCGMRDYYAPKM